MTSRSASKTIEVSDSAKTYPDGRADAGAVLSFFTSLVRELGVALDTTAFLRRLQDVELLAPVYVGERLELTAEVLEEEDLAVHLALSAAKPAPSANDEPPEALMIPVFQAKAMYVTPKTV